MLKPKAALKLPSFKTLERAINKDELAGWCIKCGHRVRTDPDAHEDPCPKCGAKAVYGAEEMVLQGLYR